MKAKCPDHRPWVIYHQATGYYEKRDHSSPDTEVTIFRGRAEQCWHCGSMWFICDDPRLRIVKVEKGLGRKG